MTSTETRPTTRDVALLLAALDATAKGAKAMDGQARAIAASDYLAEGERVPIVDPEHGTTLGFVARTVGATTAEVTDEATLTAYLAEEDPDNVETCQAILTDRMPQVINILREHAPHLLTDEQVQLRPWAREAAVKAAVAGELSPGIEVRRKPGHITITRVTDEGRERLRQLVTTGHVDPFRALPAGTES